MQLAEKSFLGVFKFLNLPKQTKVKQSSAGALNDLKQAQSTQQHPVQEEEEEDSPDEDGVGVDMATFTIAPADVTATSMTSAQSASTTATNMMGQLCWTDAASATASEVVMDMVETCEEGNLNGPQDELDEPDDQGSEVVRVLTLRPVWTDVVFMQGAHNDTSCEVIEKGVFGNNEDLDISGNKSGEEENYTNNPIHEEAYQAVNVMLEDLHQSHSKIATGATGSALSIANKTLDLWNDHVALGTACVKLGERCKENSLDVLLRGWITAMVGVLNLYLDSGLGYSWINASLIVVKARGQGKTHTRNLQKWILDFIQSDQLPLHHYGQPKWTVLDDEDISQSLQLQLLERAKCGYLKAADVVEIVTSTEMQTSLTWVGVCKPMIAERTAWDWLKKLNWRYEEKKSGMYIDGHEQEDVVEYQNVFVARWKEYEACFNKWDNDGNPLPHPISSGIHSHLILITCDELTFYQNDERKTHWAHSSSTATPKLKGNGQSLMVSDFLTLKWGCLCHRNECICSFFPSQLHLTHPNMQSSQDFIQSQQKS